MLSTAVMVKLGKVHSNLMVNLLPISSKLRERAKRIVMAETGVDYKTAAKALRETGYDIKVAIVMLKAGVGYNEALDALRKADGNLEEALNLTLSSKQRGS